MKLIADLRKEFPSCHGFVVEVRQHVGSDERASGPTAVNNRRGKAPFAV